MSSDQPNTYGKMGFSSDFGKDSVVPNKEMVNPNPNPGRYELLRSYLSKYTKVFVIEIKYVGCTNYEGKKILVFISKRYFDELHRNKWIDPHFTPRKGLLARFCPNEWDNACMFADKVIV